MFRKTCAKCKSPNVNVLKSFNGWKTLHQFCRDCGTDQTAIGLKKARITRYKPRRASKTSRSKQSTTYAIGLVLWAIFSVVAYGATAYAEMSTEIVYVAEVATSTPVEIVKPVETEKKPETIVQKIETKEEIATEKIAKYAKQYGVSEKEMYETVKCETAGTFDPAIRSRYLEGTSRHERSWGLSQIHLTSHPYISYEQATDPDFALEFMARNFSKGKQNMWSCWKKLKKSGII